MSLLKFEIRKIWRQKKLFWLLIVVLLCVGGLFYQNKAEQAMMGNRALEKISVIVSKTDELYAELKPLDRENRFTEQQASQFAYLNEMATALFKWKSAIYGKRWEEIPEFEHLFLTNLLMYEEAGGNFPAHAGMEREMAIEKNAWLLEHGLPYVDEAYPTSSVLLLKESASILLGLGGLFVLFLLFGNTYTAEKEQQTLLTLKTQPLSRWNQIVSKYYGLLIVMLTFIAILLLSGWAIPTLFGGAMKDLHYPLLLIDGGFTFIPAWHYLARMILLFLCAGAFMFAMLLFVGSQLRSSFSALMVTGFVILVGFVVTELHFGLQRAWNPFQFFRASDILTKTLSQPDRLYVTSAIVWSALLLFIANLLPEGEKGLFKSSELKKPFLGGKTRKLRAAVNSVSFEWRKTKRRGLLHQTLIVLALMVVVGYFMIAEQAKVKEREFLTGLSTSIVMTETEWIPYFHKSIEEAKERMAKSIEAGEDGEAIYGFSIEMSKKYIEDAYGEISLMEHALVAYERSDWSQLYRYQLYSANKRYESAAESKKFNYDPYSIFGYETSIAQLEWLKEHDIKPVFSGIYLPNIYDHYKEEYKKSEKLTVQHNRKMDSSGLFSMYMYFNHYLYFVPLLLLLFLVGTGFAGERGKRQTLRLLETMSVPKQSIFLGKVVHASIVAVLSSFGIFLFVVLIGTLFNRFGDWMYPVLHYDNKQLVESAGYTGTRAFDGGYHFLPIGEYLLYSLALFVCILLFLIVFSHVLALFIPQTFGVFATLTAVSVAGFMFSEKLGNFVQFSPFTYLDIGRIVNGEVATVLNNPDVTVWSGCLVLLGLTTGLVVIGYGVLSLKMRVGSRKGKQVIATTT